jgi:HSP20 family protein
MNRLANLRDEMNRLFELTTPTRETGLFGGWFAPIDVYEDKDQFVVLAELPGMRKEQIDLSLRDGTITITGERKREPEAKEGTTFRSERAFGKFQRSLTLPASVDPNKVQASYKDGVLRVELSKSEEAKQKHIEEPKTWKANHYEFTE